MDQISFNNPLSYLYDGFNDRPTNYNDNGGQFQPDRYFSGKTASPFFGLSHSINKNLLFKLEYDSTFTPGLDKTFSPGLIGYEKSKEDFSYSIEYTFRKQFYNWYSE